MGEPFDEKEIIGYESKVKLKDIPEFYYLKEEEEKVKEQKEEKVEEKAEEKAGQEIGKEEQEIIVKYVKVESGLEAKAMMQKERLEDGYYHYPKFDINV